MPSKATKKKEHIRVSVTELLSTKIYNAIDKPIMELRLAIQSGNLSKSTLDQKLYDLAANQWKEIASILKIKNP